MNRFNMKGAEEKEEGRRGQHAEKNGQREMKARIDTEERMRYRNEEREPRTAGDDVAPVLDRHAAETVEPIVGGVDPVVVIEASVPNVGAEDEHRKGQQRDRERRELKRRDRTDGRRSRPRLR